MPKYIRTGGNDTWEDVYEVIGEEELYWEIKDKSIPKCIALISKCNVIKTSDKIEDLIDEYIRVNHYVKSKPYLVKPLPRDWETLGENSYEIALQKEINDQVEMKNRGDDFDLYGAIWIEGTEDESILKSVSKINSEGELELL